MKTKVKKKFKNFLQKFGLYIFFRTVYIYFLKQITFFENKYLKLFYKTAPILLYHRINNVSEDKLMLCVSPECFEKHLIFIKKNYDIIHLSKLSEKITKGTLRGNEISITFDDGYKDNFVKALPLLEKYNIPATIFITTKYLGKRSSFKWDLEYKVEDRAIFLNENEIRILSDHPLIEIGGHTHYHRKLSKLRYEEQKKDILENKNILEKITKKEITLFAYPFGEKKDFNKISEKIIKELGFSYAYSNTQLLSRKTKKRFDIPRINIRECDECKILI